MKVCSILLPKAVSKTIPAKVKVKVPNTVVIPEKLGDRNIETDTDARTYADLLRDQGWDQGGLVIAKVDLLKGQYTKQYLGIVSYVQGWVPPTGDYFPLTIDWIYDNASKPHQFWDDDLVLLRKGIPFSEYDLIRSSIRKG